jgi:hypothetical protein
MRAVTLLIALLATSIGALATPSDNEVAQRKPAPPPCKRMSPPPSEAETKARFGQFVEVFVGPKKDISKAFEFIAADYIV